MSSSVSFTPLQVDSADPTTPQNLPRHPNPASADTSSDTHEQRTPRKRCPAWVIGASVVAALVVVVATFLIGAWPTRALVARATWHAW